jgi:hypothetical protein
MSCRAITPEGFSLGSTEILFLLNRDKLNASDNREFFRKIGIPPSRMKKTFPIVANTVTEMERFSLPFDLELEKAKASD